MTLREQRAIVYPPEYNLLLDEWWLYETEKNKRKIIFILGFSTIGLYLKYAWLKIKDDLTKYFNK